MIYTHAAAFLIGAAVAGAGAWKVQAWRADSAELAQQEVAREVRIARDKTIDTAAEGHERDKTEIRTEFVTITEQVERIVREPFYVAADAPACLDDDGLRQLAQAIRPSAPAGEPSGTLPRPPAPK